MPATIHSGDRVTVTEAPTDGFTGVGVYLVARGHEVSVGARLGRDEVRELVADLDNWLELNGVPR
jgi:hypothetical protein